MPEPSSSHANDDADSAVAGTDDRGERAAARHDWASDVAGRLESAVGTLRSRTSDRLVDLARLVVFGLLAGVMAFTALVLALIAFVRLLDVALPGEVWLPYLVLGALFLALGAWAWPKRPAPPGS